MNYLHKIYKFTRMTRFKHWWNYKIPPMLCFAYIFIAVNSTGFLSAVVQLTLFLIWAIATAGTGHMINDIADIESDRDAGKHNQMAGMPGIKRAGFLVSLFFISLLPWLILPFNKAIFWLIVLELALFVFYSFPPIRLKESVFGGIIADAMYGHVIIIVISALTFSQTGNTTEIGFSFWVLIVTWQLMKGQRNIILHQLDDRKNDKNSNTETFIVRYGPMAGINYINYYLLPVETVLFISVLIYISIFLDYFYISFLIFIIFTYFKFSLWELGVLPPKHFRKKFLYFLNDYYEDWMPVLVFIYMIRESYAYCALLIAHILLFKHIIRNFADDFKIISGNVQRLIG